jgi:hypothetical protein
MKPADTNLNPAAWIWFILIMGVAVLPNVLLLLPWYLLVPWVLGAMFLPLLGRSK